MLFVWLVFPACKLHIRALTSQSSLLVPTTLGSCGCVLQVITKKTPEGTLEPYEDAYVEVPEEHVGQCVDLLGSRKGRMLDMSVNAEGLSCIKYRIPTRCGPACTCAIASDICRCLDVARASISFHDYAYQCTAVKSSLPLASFRRQVSALQCVHCTAARACFDKLCAAGACWVCATPC